MYYFTFTVVGDVYLKLPNFFYFGVPLALLYHICKMLAMMLAWVKQWSWIAFQKCFKYHKEQYGVGS